MARDDRHVNRQDEDSILRDTLRAYDDVDAAAPAPVDREDLDALLSEILQEYPAFARHNFTVRRGLTSSDRRLLEFYPPWESFNPVPGRHTVEILNNQLRGRVLKDLVAADMLHALGAEDPRTRQPVDPTWRAMKTLLKETLTPRQQAMERAIYNNLVSQGREHRPFDTYLDHVRLDGYIRAGLFPMVNPAWRRPGTFTEEQDALFRRMRDYLMRSDTTDQMTPPPDLGRPGTLGEELEHTAAEAALQADTVPGIPAGARSILDGLKGAAYYGSGPEIDHDAVVDVERRVDRLPYHDRVAPGVGPGWPRPFERETPGETRTREDAIGRPYRPSIVPSATALATLRGVA